MNKINKVFNFEIKQLGPEEDRVLEMIGSTEDRDRDGDIIDSQGWDLTDYLRNPVILGFHEYDKFPYARSRKTYVDPISRQLKFEVQFPTIEEMSSYPDDPKMVADHAKNVDLAYNMYRNGYMKAVSVGFIGKESEPIMEEGRRVGKTYKAQSLLELSLIPVPSNPMALAEARSKGVISDEELIILEEKEKDLEPEAEKDPEPEAEKDPEPEAEKDPAVDSIEKTGATLSGKSKSALEGIHTTLAGCLNNLRKFLDEASPASADEQRAMAEEINTKLAELKDLMTAKNTEASQDEIDLDAIEMPEAAPASSDLEIDPGELKALISEALKTIIEGGYQK